MDNKHYRYAVSVDITGTHGFLRQISARFRRDHLGFQQSFRKKNDLYILKLHFFEVDGYRKVENFIKILNFGKINNRDVNYIAKIRKNSHSANVLGIKTNKNYGEVNA